MVGSCCVFNCSNSVNNNPEISYHRFPKVNTRFSKEYQELQNKRRKAWFIALKRDNIKESQLNVLRICSEHFITGEPSDFRAVDDPDWVPSLKMGYVKSGISPSSKMKRFRCSVNRGLKRKLCAETAESTLASSFDIDNVSLEIQASESTETGVSVQTDLTNELLTAQESRAVEQNRQIYEIRNKLEERSWSNESCLADDKKCLFFTGLPNVRVFQLLQSRIENGLSAINVGKLNNFQKLLLTLMKLRNNNSFRGLAYRFEAREDKISICFKKVVVLIEYSFRFVVHWPERDSLQLAVPDCFLKTFGRSVAVIIDCFEISTQKPANVKAKALIFSQYKHNYTIKYLIGITPQGHISFVSAGFGGRSSNKFITQESGLLDNLLPGDIVLADRGFTVHELVSMQYAELKTPQFLREQKQLHPRDIESTRKLASVRVHVERIIGNLRKKFKILNGPVPINFLVYQYNDTVLMDFVVRASCILANLCESVIPMGKPERCNENVEAMISTESGMSQSQLSL